MTCAYLPELVIWCTHLKMCEQKCLDLFFTLEIWSHEGWHVNVNDYAEMTNSIWALSWQNTEATSRWVCCSIAFWGAYWLLTLFVYYFNIHDTSLFTWLHRCLIQIRQPAQNNTVGKMSRDKSGGWDPEWSEVLPKVAMVAEPSFWLPFWSMCINMVKLAYDVRLIDNS